MSEQVKESRAGTLFVVCFALIWTIATAAFAGIISIQVVRQADAWVRFRETSGTILACEVEESNGSDGPVYTARVQY